MENMEKSLMFRKVCKENYRRFEGNDRDFPMLSSLQAGEG
jgi:hypothetical protein